MKSLLLLTTLAGACAFAGETIFPAPKQLLISGDSRNLDSYHAWRSDMESLIGKQIQGDWEKDDGRAPYNKTHVAICWSGELRLASLIPILIKAISFKLRTKEELYKEDLFPAVRALMTIGDASVIPCLDAIESNSDSIRIENFVRVIVGVKGAKLAVEAIANRAKTTGDAEAKANLELAAGIALKSAK